MSIKDIFNAKKIRLESERLNKLIEDMNGKELFQVKEEVLEKRKEIEKINDKKDRMAKDIEKLNRTIESKRNEIIELDEEILMESFALYKPRYNFEDSQLFKDKLDNVKKMQKEMIKYKTAVTGNQNWTVNGKKTEGKKMVNDMIKLVLRAFNNECDVAISKVKFNNIEASEKRMNTSYDALNKLGKIMQVNISNNYKILKFEELYLVHEYQLKKQEEKEEQKRIREQLREEAKLMKEIEEAKKSIYKEQKHYNNALSKLKKQYESASSDEEKKNLENKINETQNKLNEIDKNLEDIDYREANQRAGYVYVISNIGSFGQDIYKIGMTRRLEPMDRVNELGDASVPFNFDVHAMIFSDDAPKLENTLHKAFENKKVNMMNTRREFFNVNLKEIEDIVKKNHDKTIDFVELPSAEQYRGSLKMRESK